MRQPLPPQPCKVLILGGYGAFGGRLARLLADEPRVELVVAGRSLARAEAFCAGLPEGARRRAMRVDREGDLDAVLAQARPDVLVDASGPFQGYGDDPYRLVRACIDHGVDYLDLADSADFVAGIGRLDAEARRAGIAVLSGVSSVPVLSAAAVRHLARGLDRVTAIRGGIAPSPYAGVGLNVIAAIASYAGKPMRRMAGGRMARAHALTETLSYVIRPPGRVPLGRRLFALVEVPDLTLFPQAWPELQDQWFGAAPAPGLLHRAFIALAWLVRLGLVGSLAPLAPLLHAAARRLRWGEARGGMFVEIEGVDSEGRAVRRAWHLIAEGDDGPFIPSMAADALIRKRLAGERPAAGARPATEALELADYQPAFARKTIHTGVTQAPPPGAPLYERVLGEAVARLEPQIQALHRTQLARGRARVERGRGPFAWLAALAFGFPPSAEDVPVEVSFTARAGGELWTRNFAGRRFHSLQTEGRGAWAGLIRERFGALSVDLAVVVKDGGLDLVVRRWTLLSLPMPLWLAPGGAAGERVTDGRFRFDVEIKVPLIGRLVRYRGWLEPA
jgi:hypothetical protein